MAGPGLGQFQQLSLQQTLAPQLQQSLQILQSPMLELRQLIQAEVEINPVLELDNREPSESTSASDGEPESYTGSEDGDRTAADFSDAEAAATKADQEDFAKEFEKLSRQDDEWREYMTQNSSYSERAGSDEEKRRQHFLDSHTLEETLQQHLMDQLITADLDRKRRALAEMIIGNIDDQGYLQATPEEMSTNTGVPPAEIQEVLNLIRTFDPSGVGAVDLRDCLMIQLERMGRGNSLEARIIDKHIMDLAKRRFPVIAKKLGVSPEQIQKCADFIATLDPKPGQRFSASPNSYVIPDVHVERVGDDYTVTLNNEYIPHLRISNTYKDLMSQNGKSQVKDYIRDKIRSGKFLIKSIHQRQQTIHNIAIEIVKRQTEFLDKGSAFLKPMNMSQIADVVGVHETTVSRAISGKYMQTPQGVFEMRYFFTPGYKTDAGEDMSNTSVKESIADLIKTEDTGNPLSDKEIVDILGDRGIKIARRTVAKYRDELNILPSSMRRKY